MIPMYSFYLYIAFNLLQGLPSFVPLSFDGHPDDDVIRDTQSRYFSERIPYSKKLDELKTDFTLWIDYAFRVFFPCLILYNLKDLINLQLVPATHPAYAHAVDKLNEALQIPENKNCLPLRLVQLYVKLSKQVELILMI